MHIRVIPLKVLSTALLYAGVCLCAAGERVHAAGHDGGATRETAGDHAMKRVAPAVFNQGAMTIDRVLTWRGERKSAIVFVTRDGAPDAGQQASYVLVPTAAREFRGFLLDLGFERGSVDAYLQKPVFEIDQVSCLALAASPQLCIDVRLQLQTSSGAQGQRQEELAFVADDTGQRLVAASLGARSLALVGATNLSLGTTRSTAGSGFSGVTTSNNLSYATRGVLSKSDSLLQYDITGSINRSSAGDGRFEYAAGGQISKRPQSVTNLNLLAAGKRLGLEGGTAYAGVFPSDVGLNAGAASGANLFFVNSTILGLAWKSDGGDISSFGRVQRVRLYLLSPAYVRIVSQGAQLFEGQLQPGERIVSFPGYGQSFVDVLVRDINGVEQRQRAEVLPTEPGDAPAFDRTRRLHGFYVDIGKPVLQNTFDGTTYRRLRMLDQTVASFGYTHVGAWGRLRSGVQSGTGFTRVATSLSSLSLSSQGSLMWGTHAERGFSASYQPLLESGWQPSAQFTRYQTSRASRELVGESDQGSLASTNLAVVPWATASSGMASGANCRLLVYSLQCYSPANYRSTTLGMGHRDWPLRLTYSETRSDSIVFKRATLQASFSIRIAGRRSNLLMLLGYEPATKSKALLVSLVIPLDSPGAMLTSSGSTDFQGTSSVSAGYSQSLDAATHDHLRSYSLNASTSRNPGDGGAGSHSEAAIAYVSSQLGSIANTTSLSAARNTTSMQTTFATDYAFTGDGAAFTRENMGMIGSTRLFDAPGSAGVAIANRSQDPQTALIAGASVDVPPGKSVYVPVMAGYLQGVTVSPGPALGEEQAKAGQYLHKGNVKSVVIADGFWIMARFESPAGRALPVQFTFKHPGEKLERLYLDSRMQAMLFELREDAPVITRFVVTEGIDGRPGDEYRCTVPQTDAPRSDQVSTYQLLRYACVPMARDPAAR